MSKTLNKDYVALDANERAALLIMAFDGNDEVEQARLNRTAPRSRICAMHHTKRVTALCTLALNYRCKQLETVFVHLLLQQWLSELDDDQPEWREEHWAQLMTTWNYIQEMQAFDAFCENHGLKRKLLTAAETLDMMDLADERMAFLAPSTEELIAIAQEHGFECPEALNTAEHRIIQYEEAYAQLMGLTT